MQMPDDETGIRSISVSRDGAYCAIASNKGKVYVYKLRSGDAHNFEHVVTIDAHSKYILKTVFSPDTSYVLSRQQHVSPPRINVILCR
jgi:WD40 repeat protein